MVECDTMDEARALDGVILIEVSVPIRAYFAGDTLPAYCLEPENPTPS